MLSIPGHVTPSIDCGHKGLPLRNGVCNGYKVAKHDWKINEVSARIGAQWVIIPLECTDVDPWGEKVPTQQVPGAEELPTGWHHGDPKAGLGDESRAA